MAVSIRRGGEGYLAALVVFVVLFVVALIAAVLFYTQINAARLEAQTMRKERERFLKRSEENQPEIRAYLDSAPPGESLFVRLFNENKQLKQLVSGNPTESLAVIEQQARALGQPLLGELRRLRTELEGLQKAKAKLEEQYAAAIGRLAQLEEEKKAHDQKLAEAESQLRGRLEQLSRDLKALEDTATGERKNLQDRLAQLQSRHRQEVSELQNRVDQLQAENSALRAKIDQLMPRGKGNLSGPDPATLPDGRVAGVTADGKTVYLDIGRKHHVTLGLSFVVFDRASRLVRDPETGELTGGKGIIEVVGVAETSSTARVVKLDRGATIVEGDLVANVVYDPNLTYKFVVFGDFDIDRTGRPSAEDRQRIENMIRQWGGRVVEQMNYDVDFLVIGAEPAMPQPLPRDVRDPLLIEQHARQQRLWEQYQRLLAEAQRYQIPVLNQNRFLQLVGYFQR